MNDETIRAINKIWATAITIVICAIIVGVTTYDTASLFKGNLANFRNDAVVKLLTQ